MSEPEPRCYRPDCVEHDYEARTCTLSWAATNAALASVYPHWFSRYETIDAPLWIDVKPRRDPRVEARENMTLPE